MSIYGLLGQLEARTVLDTMAKEVVGINAPKIALTRTRDERLDTAISEVGNTVTFFGIGGLTDQVLKRVFKGYADNSWSVIGRSGALFSITFALMWAMPFIRNYITAKRTGKVAFTEVIGDAKSQNRNDPQDEARLKQALNKYKKTALTVLGLGLGLAATSAVGGRLAAQRNWKLGILKPLTDGSSLYEVLAKSNWLKEGIDRLAAVKPLGFLKSGLQSFKLESLLLKGGSFSNFSGLPALLFWGLPAYGGWIHASRDGYEKKEQLLKFATFTFGFFAPGIILGKVFKNLMGRKGIPEFVNGKRLELKHKVIQEALTFAKNTGDQQLIDHLRKAEKLWAGKVGASLLISILLLGTLPQLLNIYLTKRRMAQKSRSVAAAPPLSLPPGPPLQKKSFAEWMQSAPVR